MKYLRLFIWLLLFSFSCVRPAFATNDIAVVALTSATTPSGVTYGGSAMSRAVSTSSLVETIWYLTNPPTGTKQVAVSWGATTSFTCGWAAHLTGVNTAAVVNASGTGAPTVNITLTTSSNSCLTVTAAGGSPATRTVTAASSQTSRGSTTVAGTFNAYFFTHQLGASGATADNWTGSGIGASNVATIAVAGLSGSPPVLDTANISTGGAATGTMSYTWNNVIPGGSTGNMFLVFR